MRDNICLFLEVAEVNEKESCQQKSLVAGLQAPGEGQLVMVLGQQLAEAAHLGDDRRQLY